MKILCSVFSVSRSGFYAWLNRPESSRARRDKRLKAKIHVIYHQHKKRYGSPRITEELKSQGESTSVHRVSRLMRESGLRAVPIRRFKVTTDSRHNQPVAPNLLGQQFKTKGENQVWLSDITYLSTHEGWLYLAVVMDLHSRRVVGWKCSERLTTPLVSEALAMAYWQRKPKPGLIMHSDRGIQYASNQYQQQLKQYGMVCSMSRKGNCWDNAPMESFFHTLKNEEVYQERYQTRKDAKNSIREYIMAYYNSIRRHSALGYLSPMQFEANQNLVA